MRHAWFIALALIAGAGAIAYALIILSGELRHVSNELDVIARNLSSMSDDVRSLADDVNALADALTGADDAEEQESPIAIDVVDGGHPPLGGGAGMGHAAGVQPVASARFRRSRAVPRPTRDSTPRRRWISAAPPAAP